MVEAQNSGTGRRPTTRALPPRVLVVTADSEFARAAVEALARGDRFLVLTATSVDDARTRSLPTLCTVVVDCGPGTPWGLDLLREIRASCNIPVVALTSPGAVGEAVESLNAGAYGCLEKTAGNLELLPVIVGRAVEESARRREHRTMRDQLERVATLAGLGTFAAGMCHEMNNPLAAILGYTQLYERGFTDIAKCMDVIATSAKRLSDVVNSLSAFAAGSVPPREAVDLGELVRDELDKRKDLFSHEGVEVAYVPPATPVLVKGNRPALAQVLTVLVRNARQAMKLSETKRLTVSLGARAGGDGACLQVEDTGTGVPEDIRRRIFDPFFTTREPGEGTGMGLAIAHRVVDGHGGRIRCESTSRGGARFVVELPPAPG